MYQLAVGQISDTVASMLIHAMIVQRNRGIEHYLIDTDGDGLDDFVVKARDLQYNKYAGLPTAISEAVDLRLADFPEFANPHEWKAEDYQATYRRIAERYGFPIPWEQ